jgi:copper chaperone CopZ
MTGIKYFVSLVAVAFLLVGGGGCRVKDVRTVSIQVPGMQCAECEQRVTRALAALEGVKGDSIKPDTASKVVSVTYDSMKVAIKNLEYAIANAGYTVVTKPYDLPADPKAVEALPPECRDHAN